MPGESMKCGQSHAPPPAPAQTIHMLSPSTSGGPCRSNTEGKGQRPQRPSVLRQAFQTPSSQQSDNKKAIPICEDQVDGCCFLQTPSPPSSLRQSHPEIPSMRDGETQSSVKARMCESVSEGTSALFVSGLCRWPGCEALSTDFPSFLKHLHSEHSHGERSVAQCRIQQDIVQCLESQLILEKQKLAAMQLHLHLSEHKLSGLGAASEWPYSLPLFLPEPQAADGEERVQQWCLRQLEELSQHGFRASSAANLLSDFVPSMEYYKYKNIRPPYTYAYLIRWSIMESPDKQRTLNEIYNWFTSMFYYFRHNTATWKNAVRHNLSLHKCFVRVEGGKGAVWTVDETEYQRRKGQKYHRDCPVKWFSPYPHYCP